MTTLVYTVAKERFGTKKTRRPKPQQTPNRRQSRIKQIRGELKSLNKAYKKASQEERLGLQELRDILRRELQTLRKAENARTARRKGHERERSLYLTHTNFPNNFWTKKGQAN